MKEPHGRIDKEAGKEMADCFGEVVFYWFGGRKTLDAAVKRQGRILWQLLTLQALLPSIPWSWHTPLLCYRCEGGYGLVGRPGLTSWGGDRTVVTAPGDESRSEVFRLLASLFELSDATPSARKSSPARQTQDRTS